MKCFCCNAEVRIARKVKLRRAVYWVPTTGEVTRWDAAVLASHIAYREQTTYRWAAVCLSCYRILDNDFGLAEIAAQVFNIAGTSRGDKACTINEDKYQTWQKREASKVGVDYQGPGKLGFQ